MANWQEGDTIIGVTDQEDQVSEEFPVFQVVEVLPNGNFLIADIRGSSNDSWYGETTEVDSDFLDDALRSYKKAFDDAYVAERMVGEWD